MSSPTWVAQSSHRALSSEGDSRWTSPSRACSIASRSVATLHSVANAGSTDRGLGVGWLPSAQEGAHPLAQAWLGGIRRSRTDADGLHRGRTLVRLDLRGRLRTASLTLQSGI